MIYGIRKRHLPENLWAIFRQAQQGKDSVTRIRCVKVTEKRHQSLETEMALEAVVLPRPLQSIASNVDEFLRSCNTQVNQVPRALMVTPEKF
jgi:hypothetical protein